VHDLIVFAAAVVDGIAAVSFAFSGLPRLTLA
jgi:hypothetical protein